MRIFLIALIFLGSFVSGCEQAPPLTESGTGNFGAPDSSRSLQFGPSAARRGAPERENRVIVAFGDSLTAGMGVPLQGSYPALLQEKLRAAGYPYRVVNMGVSGDTTAGGLRRLDRILNENPEIVILELGANDGLRGVPLDQIRENLGEMIRRLKAAEIHVILAGMKLPPNYGLPYTSSFSNIFKDLARQYEVPLIPFFLEDVATRPELNQDDGLHPTSEGYRKVVENLWPILLPFLDISTGSRMGMVPHDGTACDPCDRYPGFLNHQLSPGYLPA